MGQLGLGGGVPGNESREKEARPPLCLCLSLGEEVPGVEYMGGLGPWASWVPADMEGTLG